MFRHSIHSYPDKSYDAGIIYADYYFLEAAKKIIDRHYMWVVDEYD